MRTLLLPLGAVLAGLGLAELPPVPAAVRRWWLCRHSFSPSKPPSACGPDYHQPGSIPQVARDAPRRSPGSLHELRGEGDPDGARHR